MPQTTGASRAGIGYRRQQLGSPLAHHDVLLIVLAGTAFSFIEVHHLSDTLQHHLVGADGLSGEDAKSLTRIDVSTNKRRRLAEVTAEDKRAQVP